jgi:hypothetical protein
MATLKTVREEDGFDLPKLGVEDGTAFGWYDRWNVGMTPDGKYLTDLSDWEARDMHDMLKKDYKSAQIERVLSLPITSAEFSIEPAKGDKGEAAWLKSYWETDFFAGGCRTSLSQILGLLTSAFYYKRAYFEKVFAMGTGQFAGKIVYEDVAWRPQTTCRMMRDPKTGRARGFEQEAFYMGPEISRPNKWPIQIKSDRAFVYTHGTRRDPLNGTSDMEVAYWAWSTKQKVLMLWMQFLQSVSLPRTIVKAGDNTTARQVAQEIARMKSSGVLPVATPGGPDSIGIDVLDVSGAGAQQFMQAIQWLDTAATQSVLAGFLDLTAALEGGKGGLHGSYALSKDASDFFLQSLEAKAHEIEVQVRYGLFAPLILHNFGPNAAVPTLKFEPLNDIDKETAVGLLKQAMIAPPTTAIPSSFTADLAGQVATYLGLDGESTKSAFKTSFDQAAAEAKANAAKLAAGGGTPIGQAVAGMAGATRAAQSAVQKVQVKKAATKQAKAAAAPTPKGTP